MKKELFAKSDYVSKEVFTLYSVVLVDDEKSVLEILLNSIDWQQLGINSIRTASDGYEALALLENQPTDLLLSDIKMPNLDGLELIRRVRELYPSTRCILLTAYSEFDYAKKAIALGVENYLLKPVAKKEIEQTLENALDNLYSHRSNSVSLLRENTLRRWLNGTISSEELSERAAILDITLYLPEYNVLCIAPKNKSINVSAFCTQCVESLKKQYEAYTLWDDSGRYIIILAGKYINWSSVYEEIAEIAFTYELENKMVISFGLSVQESDSLHLSYQTSRDTIDTSDITSAPLILTSAPLHNNYENYLWTERIRTFFFENNAKKRSEQIEIYALELCNITEENNYQNVISELVKTCIRSLIAEFPTVLLLQDEIYTQTQYLEKISSKNKFFDVIKQEIEYACHIFSLCFSKFSPIVQYAIQYIRNSVLKGDGISLKELCNKIGMNPAYLGHLFKEETGIFFNDYLMNRRIEHSTTLLRNPEQKVKDIATKVGFTSPSYYVKCFKESKGISPAKYRMDILSDSNEKK